MENVPVSAGLSSFNLLDERVFFKALGLAPGMILLDLACGVGNYTMAASPYVGEKGQILAMDLWWEGLETLWVRADMRNVENVHPVIADAGEGLPLSHWSVDCCLMATAAHILAQENALPRVLREIRNILRPAAILAIVEFHKIEGPPGPPLAWRLSPGELENIVCSSGFQCVKNLDVGPCNYLSLFRAPG
ncbi:MAG: methyltransferase domain-containing protein [Desulfobulbaceae bacterium]|nr:methyltransferase domain-containing protein [Desulfobulbaceae bacterium]